MAGLLDTYLQNIRVRTPNVLDRDEWRVTRYGLTNAAFDMTNHPLSILDAQTKAEALRSEGRLLQVPVTKKGALTVSNVRSCTIGDFENESALVDLTWATYVVDVSMVKAQYDKNEIRYEDDLMKKLILVKEAILGEIEGTVFTKLDTDKNTVYGSSLAGGKYPLVGDALQVSLAQQERFFGDIEAINSADELYSENFVLGNHTLMPDVNHYVNQGGGNDENLNYQFAGKDFRFTNGIVNAGGVNATGFFMPHGSLGILTRIGADSRLGHKTTDGTNWSTVRIDGMPFDLGVQYHSTCSNQELLNGSGMAHLSATMIEHWQFSVDVALVTPYNSDPATKAGAIRKFEFLAV